MTKDQVRSTDEALRLALEALEDLGNHHHDCPQWPTYTEPEKYPKCTCGYDQAITSIKASLEAQTRSVVKDEPVAWIWKYANGEEEVVFVPPRHVDASHVDAPSTITSLYTTPPQRTWVGLTDEQYLEACKIAEGGNYMVAFQRIQQWLMENNI